MLGLPDERRAVPRKKARFIAVIHGPNLNLLGTRKPAIYGTTTLAQINAAVRALAGQLGCGVSTEQHSAEGDLIDAVHRAIARKAAIVINPGAYAHYSYALRDALAAAAVPKVEVHLSNIHAREPFRRRSVLAPVMSGVVAGFGADSYLLAVRAAAAMLDSAKD